ncbi:MAG: dienelactone hydrolase family protein [Phycisphaerales bacterium]
MSRREMALPRDIRVNAGGVTLDGILRVPPGASALVVFAHGSGSSRHSPRNRAVAEYLNEHGLATLLFDLLTSYESQVDALTKGLRFDIDLLSSRLEGAIESVQRERRIRHLPLGLFGASTGAAAALVAAANRPDSVHAVVSRGGRPDLAGDALERVTAPTLLIVGERDTPVLDLNRQALERIAATKRLVVTPNAGHLFEEPGAMPDVMKHAAEWFSSHLVHGSVADDCIADRH